MISTRIHRLKEILALSKIKHEDNIIKQQNLKDAHIYCVIHNISAQQYGPLLEMYIRKQFNYTKNKAENCTGDCLKNGKNIEIKVSLGGATHTRFNFVQIRPSHNCDAYLLTAYHLSLENVESEGELYIFNIPKIKMNDLIISYGGYAHGTVKEHGIITYESLNKEYALRPTINDECWNSLMNFRVQESSL